MFKQECCLRWIVLVIVFVLIQDGHTSFQKLPSKTVQGRSNIKDLISGNAHYQPMVWDPLHKTYVVFNISGNSPLHILLIREKKSHCEMFFMRFTYKNSLTWNASVGMIVCVAELQKHEINEKCTWVNDTTELQVKQGNLYGMPKDCGPWYLTVFADSTLPYHNITELSVEVSGPYDPLTFRWFRVITNLAFVPGIIIAFYRELYAECVVFILNFSLSSVYHLCEAELHCFKGYDRLHHSDMYASDLSIIVTVWAMTGIRQPLKHIVYLALAIMLQFAVGETVQSSDHFFINLVFTGLPLCYLIYQYGFRSIQNKSCYPNRKRWAFHLIPGLLLATAGALINLIITESDNYYYVHCIWHLTIMLSVAFLLPHKEDFEDHWYLDEHDKSTYTPIV